jgi:hypothetical protein
MTLSTDFANQITDAMNFIEFTDHTVFMVAEEARELSWKRFELFLARRTF